MGQSIRFVCIALACFPKLLLIVSCFFPCVCAENHLICAAENWKCWEEHFSEIFLTLFWVCCKIIIIIDCCSDECKWCPGDGKVFLKSVLLTGVWVVHFQNWNYVCCIVILGGRGAERMMGGGGFRIYSNRCNQAIGLVHYKINSSVVCIVLYIYMIGVIFGWRYLGM